MTAARVKTPCIGTCSCTFGDAICRGCKRYDTEVRDWNAMSEDERQATWGRLRDVRDRVLGQWFEVVDAKRLAAAMDEKAIRRQVAYGPLGWVEDLLRACKTQHPPYQQLGLRPLNGAEEMPLVELRAEIQDQLLGETLIVRVREARRAVNLTMSECQPGGL